MSTYRFLYYWWFDSGKEIGGEFGFAAANDMEAIKNAHARFAEEIALADQSEILDGHGRSVWSNEWPIVPD
jgi:hypothetical protein